MTKKVYYEMIYQKTASLVSTSCELGAITSTGQERDRKAMMIYGTKLGMAFQVKDDLFDLLGNEKQTGKDIPLSELLIRFLTANEVRIRSLEFIKSFKSKK